MDRLDIVNGLVFQNLRITSKDSLRDRVLLQKKVYLLQEIGSDIGYSYNWYLKGPYSPGLTSYVYDKLDYLIQTSDELNNYKLKSDIVDNIELVNSFGEGKPLDLDMDSWYELLASLRYIWKNSYLWGIEGSSEGDIIKIINIEKPHFTTEQCKEGISALKDKCLIENMVN